jgi:ubiquinone/menaquinone biosynthesis C-methylase UbiE
MASDEERWSDAVAPAWERYREQLFEAQRNVSEWLIDQVDPRPGQTVLELAAGPGETGFLAAERVGPTGTVISTDLGSGMVDAARRGAAARGLANVEFRVMDAQENDLADGSVDAVVCRFGIMLMPAPEMALRHARRVLRDGGRVAYAVWGPPDRNPWLAMLAMAVVQNGHQPPGDPFAAGGVFSLAQAERNAALLDSAGFADARVEELPGAFRYESFDDYWTMQTAVSGPLAVLVSSLPSEEASAIRSTVLAMVAPFESNGGYEFPSLAIGAFAS